MRTRGGVLSLFVGLGGCRGLDGQFEFSGRQFGPAGAVLLVIPGMPAYFVAREVMGSMGQPLPRDEQAVRRAPGGSTGGWRLAVLPAEWTAGR